jgi:arginase
LPEIAVVEAPQWQGSGSATARRLRAGARLLAGLVPAAERVRVDITDETGGHVLVENAAKIRAALEHHRGLTLVAGGDCGVELEPIAAAVQRHGDRLAVVWFDAHGDLNTLEGSPSGNPWATPLRKLIDSGAVDAADVALVGARNLDPPEEEFILMHGVHLGEEGIARALAGVACTYVAFDADVLDPAEVAVFMPEPDGLSLDEARRMLGEIARATNVLGAGLTAASFEPGNVEPLSGLTRALGL